jgi:hypothetical protein
MAIQKFLERRFRGDYSAISSGFCMVGVIGLVIVPLTGCAESVSSQPVHVKVEQAVDALMLVDLDGNEIDVWGDGAAKATVAVFLRSDCPISNRYAPELRRLHDEFAPQGVRFLMVYVDPRETVEEIRSHREEYDDPGEAVRDPTHALVKLTGASVTPEAVVFDQQLQRIYRGRIDDQFVELGKSRATATRHDLEEAIRATLAGETVAEAETDAVGCYIEDLD